MKKRIIGVLVFAVILSCCIAASAQSLPGVSYFSVGLARLSDAIRETGSECVDMSSVTIESAMFVQDLSVLRDIFSGLTMRYVSALDTEEKTERLSIAKSREICEMALTQSEGTAWLELDGESFALTEEMSGILSGGEWAALLDDVQWLERYPLSKLEEKLISFKTGDALPGGWSVVQGFTVSRTMSDDGERLTKLNISGSIGRQGEAPYVISGFIRQPGGKAPKDTMEITAVRDEKNQFTFTMSSARTPEVETKNRKGENKVDTTLVSEGKLDGCRVYTKLVIRQRNNWTADGENLSERIVVKANLTHMDKRPEAQASRIGNLDAELRDEIVIKSAEGMPEAPARSDKLTLRVMTNDNEMLSLGAALCITIPEVSVKPAEKSETMLSVQNAPEQMERLIRRAAVRLYQELSPASIEKIGNGLE